MKRDIIILIILASFVLLFRLGAGSLSSWDEAFYAQVSREVAMAKNPIDFLWTNTGWTDKPLLYMWVTAFFYNLFGINEFSARLFSSLSGICLIILTYLFARKNFSQRIGLISSIMLLSTYHFVWFCKMGTLDIAFTLFIFATIYSFLESKVNHINMIYSFIWFSFAFLVKGVGAFLVPMILILYVLAGKQWKMLFNRYTVFGIFIFLFIAGGWYLVRFLLYGQSVLEAHFNFHLIKRTMNAIDGHQGTWLSYINAVLYKGKPWGSCALVVLPFFIFHAIKKRQLSCYLLLSWIIVVFCVFTLVKTKLHWYIIPVYPALMIVASWGVDMLLKRYAVVIVAVVSLASLFYFGMKKDIFTLDFNPEIKRLANIVMDSSSNANKVYLYNMGDPAIRFYFNSAKNINSEDELLKVANEKDSIIVMDAYNISKFDIHGEIIPSERSDIVAVRIK